MTENPDIGIVRFPGAELMTLEEARTGRYVFAAGPRTSTIYAFDREQAGERRADEIRVWARLMGLEEQLARGRAKLKKLLDDPNPRVDTEAEVKQIRRRIEALARQTDVPIGPRLLHTAVRCGIFGSAVLFREPLYRGEPTCLPLSSSCPDLSSIHGWTVTNSCTSEGYDMVCLYGGTDYGPDPPCFTLVGTDGIDLIPCAQVSSVAFA